VQLVGSIPDSASDAADIDSHRPQLLHLLLVGSGISQDDVDLFKIANMAERHAPELRGVGHRDDPLRGSGGGALDSGLGEKVGRDARLGVDAARAHYACVEAELRKGWFGETPRQRQLSRTDFATREQEFDARALVQLEDWPKGERHDGQPPAAERSCHLHGGGTTVENDRLAVGQETGRGGPYRGFGVAALEGPDAVRGLLGTEEDTCRPAVHTSKATTALQRLEVTTHRHLRAIQGIGQLPDQHRTALAERLKDHLVTGVHIHNVQSNMLDVRSHTCAGHPPVGAVVFDVGGVLLDWNPRHLYRKLFANRAEMEWFLAKVCSATWHAPHDRGVSTAASCAELARRYPEHSELIWAWWNRSEEMIGGVDAGSVGVLTAVRETGLPRYALTNMESETYPLRLQRFPFLGWFDGTVVSGREGVAKPEAAIFRRLLDRFDLRPNTTLMIDDTKENLETAGKLGIQTVRFRSSRQLRAELEAVGVLARSRTSP
jgi:2-haloacid dehalogenase